MSARERATPADRSCDSDSAPVYRPYRKHLAGATSVAESIGLAVQTRPRIITAVADRLNFSSLNIQVVTKKGVLANRLRNQHTICSYKFVFIFLEFHFV